MDSNSEFLWNTFDFGRSVQGFELPFKPTDLLLHSRKPDLLLGYDGSHPNKQVSRAGRQEGLDPLFTALIITPSPSPSPSSSA